MGSVEACEEAATAATTEEKRSRLDMSSPLLVVAGVDIDLLTIEDVPFPLYSFDALTPLTELDLTIELSDLVVVNFLDFIPVPLL